MRSPLERGAWHEFDEVLSTQDLAAARLLEGEGGVFFAHHQSLGRGRFGREWVSARGDSLTMSLAFTAYADHPRPYLIGMAVAVAAAAVLRCELAWPNDLMAGDRKLGGILTELLPDREGRRVPVVGVGINLNQGAFPPEIAHRATSVRLYSGGVHEPLDVAQQVVERLAALPEPDAWSDLLPVWELFDYTPGKSYRLPNGEEAIALGIGPEGQLICAVGGETRSVMAGEAILGITASAT